MSPASSPFPGAGRLHLAVFLQGSALLGLEVILTRVLAVVMWHHFASLVISLALLGMTIGAVAVYLRPSLAGSGEGSLGSLAASNYLFGLSSAGVFAFFWLVTLFPTAGYRFFSVMHQPYFEPFGARAGAFDWPLVVNLLLLFLVMAVPFFAGGMFITAIFARWGRSAGSLYAADLLGAGFGCFMAVAVLSVADGLSAVLLAGLPALAAAVLLWGRGRRGWLAAATLLAVLALALLNLSGPFARIMFVRGRYQPDILHERWNATSRVVVYPLTGHQEEGSWGQSRRFADRIPPQMGLVVDDTGYTTLTAWPADGDLTFMRHNLISLPYLLKPGGETMIIGPGGGRDILAALSMGAGKVTAVELNPLVVEAVDEVFGEFSGHLYSRPGVTTHVAEGRSYLRRDSRLYDVLQASIVYGRLPPSAGAFTLSEDQLYTLESFREYLGHLKEDGLLAITRFIYEKRILRLVSLGWAVLEEAGEPEPWRHFFIASERGLATVIIKKKPLEAGEIGRLEDWCRQMGYQILYSPGLESPGSFQRLLSPEGREAFLASFPFDLSPPTDDRPYFYYLLKPSDFWRSLVGRGNFEFEDRAIIVVRDALAILAFFTLLLVLLPLGRRFPGGGDRRAALGALAYFGGIALGFITVEIVVLKVFILYLGFPVLSLSVVLAALLLSAGAGSYGAQRWFAAGKRGRLAAWLTLVAAGIALFPALTSPVLDATMASPLPLRVLLAVLLTMPVGFLMGVPLPAGMQVVRRRDLPLTAWAFGVNGALSVIGAMVALVLALNYGFRLTLLAAPAGYLAAALGLGFLGARGREEPPRGV